MKEIERECPNGWTCEDCQHENVCAIGQYYVEPAITIIEIADKIEKEVVKEASKDAKAIMRGTWFDNYNRMNADERWNEYGKWPTPHLHYKEPYKALEGPTAPGGGGSKNSKKSKKGNKPTQYLWGEFR